MAQVERALLEVVHDAAGCADDDVHATAQRGQLDAVPLAAVDGQDVQALDVGGVAAERLGDLQCQLARRGEHEDLRELWLRSRRDRMGSAKAAVLPVPVWASPTTC